MPRSIKLIVCGAAVVFSYGTVVHAVAIADRGLDAYERYPMWLALYFTLLVVFDAVAALLLLLGRRIGLVLGCAVLATDAAANGYANYVFDPGSGGAAGRVFQAFITVLAIGLLTTAPRVWPWLR